MMPGSTTSEYKPRLVTPNPGKDCMFKDRDKINLYHNRMMPSSIRCILTKTEQCLSGPLWCRGLKYALPKVRHGFRTAGTVTQIATLSASSTPPPPLFFELLSRFPHPPPHFST